MNGFRAVQSVYFIDVATRFTPDGTHRRLNQTIHMTIIKANKEGIEMKITKQWVGYIGIGMVLTLAAILLGFVLISFFGFLSVPMALVSSFAVIFGATVASAWMYHFRQNPE